MDTVCWPYQVRTIIWHNLWRGEASRVKPNETFELAKKKQKIHSVLGCVGVRKKGFIFVVAKLHANFQKPWKISVLQLCSWDGFFRHDEMKITLCISSMSRGTLELILWKKEDKKCKDQKRSIFLTKGVVIGKNISQIQRINTVHSKCSSSGVLRDIPSNLTRSVRRRIVL